MQTHLTRWGNSLGLRIPKDIARRLGVGEGSLVNLTTDGGRLVLEPLPPRYRLDDLLVGMTPEAMHEALDWPEWGDERGREDVV